MRVRPSRSIASRIAALGCGALADQCTAPLRCRAPSRCRSRRVISLSRSSGLGAARASRCETAASTSSASAQIGEHRSSGCWRRLPRRCQGLVVAAKPVVEHGCCPCADRQHLPSPRPRRSLMAPSISGTLLLAALPGGERNAAKGGPVAGRRGHAVDLLSDERAGSDSPAQQLRRDAAGEGERELGERAAVAGELRPGAPAASRRVRRPRSPGRSTASQTQRRTSSAPAGPRSRRPPRLAWSTGAAGGVAVGDQQCAARPAADRADCGVRGAAAAARAAAATLEHAAVAGETAGESPRATPRGRYAPSEPRSSDSSRRAACSSSGGASLPRPTRRRSGRAAARLARAGSSSSGPASAVASSPQRGVERARLRSLAWRRRSARQRAAPDPRVSATARSQKRRRSSDSAARLRACRPSAPARRRPPRRGPLAAAAQMPGAAVRVAVGVGRLRRAPAWTARRSSADAAR